MGTGNHTSPPIMEVTRRDVLAGAVAIGALAHGTAAAQDAGPSVGLSPGAGRMGTASYVGAPLPRIDGYAKVTGAARYAGEANVPGLAYGFIVDSAIAKGRISRIDTTQARRVAGVLDVLTHENRPKMADNDAAYKDDAAPEKGSPYRPLYDDRILFSRQPVALVIAEHWETARYAASLVLVEYAEQPSATDVYAERARAFVVPKTEKPRGDFEHAYAAAAVRHEAEYFVPMEHHNPMELFGSTVTFDGGGKLTVFDKTQGVQNVQRYLCGVLERKPDEVRVVSPFMGGGFGAGLRPQHQVVLAALGALALQRPVRVVLTRGQMYSLGYRPATIERLAIGATRQGTLDAISHEAIGVTSQFEEFSRNDTGWAALLYQCANTQFVHRLAPLDVPTSADMRAPGAASGVYALECAMDELAIALDLDPMELRLRCYSDRDQNEDAPYTSKQLRECYRRGAEAFGWSKRTPEPRSMRDGTDLVGWGMATGVWEALQMPAAVRIVLTGDGRAEIASAASDIGTGTYTIMAQVAADALGLSLANIDIKLGDSTLPQCPLEGGSWLSASISNAIVNTAKAVCAELLGLAKKLPNSPLVGVEPGDVVLAGGKIVSTRDQSRAVSIADVMRGSGVERIALEKTNVFPDIGKYGRNTHSAVFAEVKIDEQLGIIRVTRVVNAVAAGRILNLTTAHSQIMGGVVWGIGMALHEETLTDHRFGRIMNANIAEYHVPVNADIHDIDIIFVDEPDDKINPLGVKGLGEIGIVAVAAAVANAVYHATGKRVRDLPITLDKLTR
jgi:xanthine dehydrogenase YagR molybdenum-binding subunit